MTGDAPPGRGTGPGPAVVHVIVRRSGGHIEVHSEPGIGTTFKLCLPVIDATVATTRPKGPQPHAEDLGVDTILVVEDADSIRRMITAILR